MHLAALIAIPYSYASPDSYVDTNVRGTLNVLQAARHAGVRRFVQTSTSEVYGTRAIRSDQGEPSAGRAIALLGIEDRVRPDGVVVSCLVRHAGRRRPAVQHLRAAPIGARRHPDHHQPDRVRQARRSASARLSPTRDFSFVTDTARGLIAGLTAPANGVGRRSTSAAASRSRSATQRA